MPCLKVHCCTWNVGDQGPPPGDIKAFLGLEEDSLPDIVGVALQEVIDEDEWRKKLFEFFQPSGLALIKSRKCWAIFILVFVRRNLLSAITNTESEVTACGFGGVMGNKGGVSIRFEICGVNIIFLSCHFAAHAENTKERINDYIDIIDNQTFRDEDVHTILDHDYVFWMGDLNFRLDNITKPEVEALIGEGKIEELLRHDQLTDSKRKGLTFIDFKEGDITFPPTFKFDKGTNRYDSSSKQRVPAWTDRILYMVHRDFAMDLPLGKNNEGRYLPTRGSPSDVERHQPSNKRNAMGQYHPEVVLLRYTSLPEYMWSDHRPVVATFKINVPPRWFSLPISFTEPSASEHSLRADLEFCYTVMDPPALLHMPESDRILSSPPPVASVDFLQLMLISSLGQVKTASQKVEEPTPAIPSALEQATWDWIGLYPADMADLEKGYLTYVNAPKGSVSTVRTALSGSKASTSLIFKGKFASHYLSDLNGVDVQLIYWSRNKNCPQGYSPIVRIKS